MKACFKCGVVKPLDAFYKHPAMTDGHLGKCIECAKVDVRQNYAEHREERSAYEARRSKTPERKAALHKQRDLHRQRHPEKLIARRAVHNAIVRGDLLRGPCGDCGTTENVEAHHHDYAKPLDIEWLCFKCHRERHGQVVVAKGAP